MWASRPVFISSTFLDMQAERDHLRRFVFPELEERLRARRQHLEWVDLRVGVATAGLADPAAREMQALKVCLAEVRRCRPFLLVLVGDRYGWCPPEERMRAIAGEAGLALDAVGRSVTEIEIEAGVLALGVGESRAVVYFRDPLPYAELPGEMRDAFADPDNEARLGDLKARIARALPDRVRSYALTWDSEKGAFSGLDAWGRSVLEDLWDALTADAEDTASPPATWQDEERAALEAFMAERGRDFVGRREMLERLQAHAIGENSAWGVCVTGEAGAGKSALFCELDRRLRGGAALVLSHAPGASPRAASLDLMLRRWIEELAHAAGIAPGLSADAGAQEVEARFAVLLTGASQTRRVIVLMDALDQFEAGVRARCMAWLPRPWPANARLIAMAIPGEAADALTERGAQLLALPRLDAGEASAIIEAVCARYHRTLEPEVAEALLDRRGADGPASGRALWLVLATEEINLVDADDLARARRQYPGPPAEQLRALLVDMARALPADIPGLYGASFDHAEALFGRPIARAFLSLLAAGRAGWRELDFRALLPRLSAEPWDELRFASLRRVFRGQIGQLGARAQWTCLHAQMRAAARARVAASDISQARLHGAIADHLLSLPADDPVRQSEAMHHLMTSAAWDRAAAYFGDDGMNADEQAGAAEVLAGIVSRAPADDALPGIAALLDAGDPARAVAAQVARRCLFGVLDRIAGRAPLAARLRLADLIAGAFERASAACPAAGDLRFDLCSSHLARGLLLQESGERIGARTAYEAALRIAEQLNEEAPSDLRPLRQILLVHQKLVGVLRESGESNAAARLARTAVAIARQFAALDPDNPMARHELSIAQGIQSDAFAAQGDLTAAAAARSQALETARQSAADRPGDPVFAHDEAHALARSAEIREQQGDLAGAEESCRAALAIFERIVAQEPENSGYRADFAVATGMLARLLYDGRDLTGAESAYDAAIGMFMRLLQKDPANAGWGRGQAILLLGRGQVQMRRRQTEAAGASYRLALDLIAPLAGKDQDNLQWRRDMAALHHALGEQLEAAGDARGAAASRAEALRLTASWAGADQADSAAQRDLALRYDASGHARLAAGDLAGAERDFRTALQGIARLVALDPANSGWRRDLSAVHDSLAELAKAGGDWSAAADAQATAVDLLAEIAAENPGNVRARIEHATGARSLGVYQLLAHEYEEAAQSFRRALDAVSGQAPTPDLAETFAALMSSLYLHLADALIKLGALAQAAQTAREGMATMREWAEREPQRLDWLLGLAHAGDLLATALDAQGDERGADAAQAAALAEWARLAARSGDIAYARGLARAHFAGARRHVERGDLAAAHRAAAPGRAALPRLQREDAADFTALKEYFEMARELGQAHLQRSQWHEAEAVYAEAMPLAQHTLDAHPDYDMLRVDQAVMAWNRAQIAHKMGRQSVALGFRAQARDEFRVLVSRGVELSPQLMQLRERLEQRG